MADKVKASDRNPRNTKHTAGLHLLAALAVDMAKRPGLDNECGNAAIPCPVWSEADE